MILEILALVGGYVTVVKCIESAIEIRNEIRWQKTLAADREGQQEQDFTVVDLRSGRNVKLRVVWPEGTRRTRAKNSSTTRTSKR